MVASAVLEDAHTLVLCGQLSVEPLVYVHVGVYCCCPPTVIVVLDGNRLILLSVGADDVTLSVTGGLATVPMVAVTFVLPAATPVASPLPLMVAALVFDDFQVIDFPWHKSVEPSLYVHCGLFVPLL